MLFFLRSAGENYCLETHLICKTHQGTLDLFLGSCVAEVLSGSTLPFPGSDQNTLWNKHWSITATEHTQAKALSAQYKTMFLQLLPLPVHLNDHIFHACLALLTLCLQGPVCATVTVWDDRNSLAQAAESILVVFRSGISTVSWLEFHSNLQPW